MDQLKETIWKKQIFLKELIESKGTINDPDILALSQEIDDLIVLVLKKKETDKEY